MEIKITGSDGGAWWVHTSLGTAQPMKDRLTARAYAEGLRKGYLLAVSRLGSVTDPVENP